MIEKTDLEKQVFCTKCGELEKRIRQCERIINALIRYVLSENKEIRKAIDKSREVKNANHS